MKMPTSTRPKTIGKRSYSTLPFRHSPSSDIFLMKEMLRINLFSMGSEQKGYIGLAANLRNSEQFSDTITYRSLRDRIAYLKHHYEKSKGTDQSGLSGEMLERQQLVKQIIAERENSRRNKKRTSTTHEVPPLQEVTVSIIRSDESPIIKAQPMDVSSQHFSGAEFETLDQNVSMTLPDEAVQGHSLNPETIRSQYSSRTWLETNDEVNENGAFMTMDLPEEAVHVHCASRESIQRSCRHCQNDVFWDFLKQNEERRQSELQYQQQRDELERQERKNIRDMRQEKDRLDREERNQERERQREREELDREERKVEAERWKERDDQMMQLLTTFITHKQSCN